MKVRSAFAGGEIIFLLDLALIEATVGLFIFAFRVDLFILNEYLCNILKAVIFKRIKSILRLNEIYFKRCNLYKCKTS